MQKTVRAITGAVSACLVLGCGAGAPAPQVEVKRLEVTPPSTKEKLSFAEAGACLSQATPNACDPALAALFVSPSGVAERRMASVWCAEGKPHVLAATKSGEIQGEFGQVVWEAIWRALDATDGCASAFGNAISITRDGRTSACKEALLDLGSLFDMAAAMAKKGPPRPFTGARHPDCEKTPSACIDSDTMCPVFFGDPWNGVRAAPAQEATDPEDYECFDDGMEERRYRARPSQGDVQAALRYVMDEARLCLPADYPLARTKVVFQKDGTVQRVEVTDVGEPAAQCIEKALKQARVACFVEPTQEVPVTIRRGN